MHLESDPALPRTEAYKQARATVGKFGVRERDGVPFLLAYHVGVFATDGPRMLHDAKMQARRAEMIECGLDGRYLFAVMNHGTGKRLGAFYDVRDHVKENFLYIPEWPGQMDIYIVDPQDKQEVDFLVSIMAELPSPEDLTLIDNRWWATPFVSAMIRAQLAGTLNDHESDLASESDEFDDIAGQL